MKAHLTTITDVISDIEQAKKSGNYKKAIQIALEGLQTHTDDYRLYEELADIYIFEHDLDKAEEVIRYARELHPDSGTGLFLEGYVLVEKGDFAEALPILIETNKVFPNNPEVLRILGWSYVMQGENHRGITFLRRALALAPDDARIEENLSHALLMSDRD